MHEAYLLLIGKIDFVDQAPKPLTNPTVHDTLLLGNPWLKDIKYRLINR